MDGQNSTRVVDQKCIQNFGQEISKEDFRPERRWDKQRIKELFGPKHREISQRGPLKEKRYRFSSLPSNFISTTILETMAQYTDVLRPDSVATGR